MEKFFRTGSTAGIQAKHAPRLQLILGLLEHAAVIGDMDFHGARLHPLKGDLKGLWAVKVSGNWRVTFRFAHGEAEIVDYQDYH